MKNLNKISILIASLILLNSCGKKDYEIKPTRKNITETVFASGILEPDSLYNLTAMTEGYIIKLNFKEGDIVETGKILAVIDNKQSEINARSSEDLYKIAYKNISPNAPALKQAKVNLSLAEQKLEQDKKQATRYKKLYELNSVSKLEYENALLTLENSKTAFIAAKENFELQKQQAEQQLIIQQSQKRLNTVTKKYNKIKAVIGGKIYNKMKEVGDYVRKGEIIAVIGSPHNLYALLNVDESNISKIRINQKVVIELNIQKTKSYSGIVSEIYPAFDEQSQSFYCEIQFMDSLDFKISGTQLQGNIIVDKKENVLVIPRDYLDYGNKVNLKDSGLVAVKTGFISNDWVEILDGLDDDSILLPLDVK